MKNVEQDLENIKESREQTENLQKLNIELEEKYDVLNDDFQLLKNRFVQTSKNLFCHIPLPNVNIYSEALLRQNNLGLEATNTALEKRNRKLQEKFQELKRKLEEIEKHSASIITVNAEKEDLQNALNEMKSKHSIQEQRIADIVKSLELIETQNALNSHNLSSVTKENLELKSAMEVLKTQNDLLKEKEAEFKETKENYQKCKDGMGKQTLNAL